MAKIRVFHLAKELKVNSALILELLDIMGKEVKSDLSTLDARTADMVRKRLTAALTAEREKLAEKTRLEQEVLESEAAAAAEQPAVEPEDQVDVAAAPEAESEQPAEVEQPAEETIEPEAETGDKPEAGPAPEEEEEEEEPSAPAEEPEKPAMAAKPSQSPPEDFTTARAVRPGTPGKRSPRVFEAKRFPTLEAIRARSIKPKPAPRPAPGQRPGMPGRTPGPAGRFGPPRAPGQTMPPGGRPGAGRPHHAPGAGPGGKRNKRKKKKKDELTQAPIPNAKPKADLPPVPENITLSEGVSVKELAEKLNRKSKDVIAKLIGRGVLATINQPLDPEMAIEVAKDFGSEAKVLSFEEMAQQQDAVAAVKTAAGATSDAEAAMLAEAGPPAPVAERPPVVTVMGHVDHGKTSLLDSIRADNVVEGEYGGITQHIGAYQAEESGRKITFLDTPGHEAFTMMRARGARATDIVILVVAADDGVKPQTLEAIDHSRAAGVPLIVAINKIDKPGAEPARVKQQLADREILVEEYGGDVVACEVSAKTKEGLDQLLEMVLLVADMLELKASPEKAASGVILEARLDKARGVICTVLVQDGTLHVGNPFIAGASHGKVRAMLDQNGQKITAAGPATPVEVMGLSTEPAAGDLFQAVGTEAKARQIAGFRQEKQRAAALAKSSRRTLESLSREIAEGHVKDLPILLKSDVQGSIEAIQKALGDLPHDKVQIDVIRASTGAISQADVLLAAASDAIIVGFNVRPNKEATDAARHEKVEIRSYTVIYDMINEITQAMIGLLEPDLKEVVLGQAQVRELFKVPKIGIIAGCYVSEGKVTRNAEVRLLRDNVVIHTGKVGSLRRFKDDAAEVKQGYECGIGIEGYNDIKDGDVIEFFMMEKVAVKSL